MPTVFMIRNKITGEYSNGGTTPRFGPKGKIWGSTSSFNGHIALFNLDVLGSVYKDCEFLSFDLSDPTTQQDINAFVRRSKLRIGLQKKHQDPTFTSFVDSMDRSGTMENFKWIVLIAGTTKLDRENKQTMAKDAIKRLGIKRVQYRTSGLTFAFANKMDAVKFRLSITGDTFTYDGTTLLAVD